jgi:hypothetical protein
MRRPLDGPVRVTSDTYEHALRGVGPATDYARPGVALPIGTPVVAPFPIARIHRWGEPDDDRAYPGGLAINAYSADGRFMFCGQHLSRYEWVGSAPEGGVIAYSGNTGASTGPHLHCYVIADGVRMSMEEFLAAYGGDTASGGEEPLPEPAPEPETEPLQEDEMRGFGINTDAGEVFYKYSIDDAATMDHSEAAALAKALGLKRLPRLEKPEAKALLHGVKRMRARADERIAKAVGRELRDDFADIDAVIASIDELVGGS